MYVHAVEGFLVKFIFVSYQTIYRTSFDAISNDVRYFKFNL